MSAGGDSVSGMSESIVEDSVKHEKELSDVNGGSNGDLLKENGMLDDHDQLVGLVMELKLQNEFLKSQFEELKTGRSGDDGSCKQRDGSEEESRENVDVKELHQRIESLSKDLNLEKETRCAAEKALEHLRAVYEEADAKAQEFSAKLAECKILPLFIHVLLSLS